jgi:hypothetical protein
MVQSHLVIKMYETWFRDRLLDLNAKLLIETVNTVIIKNPYILFLKFIYFVRNQTVFSLINFDQLGIVIQIDYSVDIHSYALLIFRLWVNNLRVYYPFYELKL